MEEDIPLLRLKGVTKDFAGTVVLEDVSFDLHKGEILGLVGENGAGKTTLMSILFGMPVIFPNGIAMAFELATYGLVAGLIYFRKGYFCLRSCYVALITAMIEEGDVTLSSTFSSLQILFIRVFLSVSS